MGRARRSVALAADHAAGNHLRYVDLSVSLMVADVDTQPDGSRRLRTESEEEILYVGGRWDRRLKKWTGEARTARVLRLHRGQEEAGRWLASWFTRYASGNWEGFRRVYSALFVGGRRSGKTHVSLVALLVYAVMNPGSTLWAVSPTQETGDEIDQALLEMIPSDWRTRSVRSANKVITFRLANRSRIILRSGARASHLKSGRVDMALLNEAQMQGRPAFTRLRSALDSGGLVLAAANPPDQPIGRWVEEHFNGARSGARDAVAFEFDPTFNPWIDMNVLLSLRGEEDEKTYAREVLGQFVEIGDTAMHAFMPSESVLDPPPDYLDVTADVTRRELGQAAGYVIGADFQTHPYMVGIAHKFFVDPADPDREPLLWIVDEVLAEKADEDDLLDDLEETDAWTRAGRTAGDGYRGWAVKADPQAGVRGDDATTPVHCAVVMDASGFFQDGAHSKGKTSELKLRARKWTLLFKPQRDSDRNPDRLERVKVTNSRLKAANGKRRMFVAKHCARTIEALKRWELRDGVPWSRSPYAHICDAVSYTAYRFFAKPKSMPMPSDAYAGVGRRFTRRSEMEPVFGGRSGGRRGQPW